MINVLYLYFNQERYASNILNKTQTFLNLVLHCLKLGCFMHLSTQDTLFKSTYLPINSLNDELNPICHLLALLGAHRILHVSRIRVNVALRCIYKYIHVTVY